MYLLILTIYSYSYSYSLLRCSLSAAPPPAHGPTASTDELSINSPFGVDTLITFQDDATSHGKYLKLQLLYLHITDFECPFPSHSPRTNAFNLITAHPTNSHLSQLSREEEGLGGSDENEVRREDQEKINRFSRLHQREATLEEQLKGKQV